MERRKSSRRPRAAGRRLSTPTPASTAIKPFPTLEDFVLHGEGVISIGEAGPVACAPVASDSHIMFAALQRRKGETLMQLLHRLDAALSRALEHDEYTDEING